MATLGFLILPGFGHLNPAITLARELRARGHRVVFLNVPFFRAFVERLGFEFLAVAPEGGSGAAAAHDAALFPALSRTRSLARRDGTRFGPARLLAIQAQFRRLVDLSLAQVPPLLAQTGTRLVLADQSIVTGRTVADLLGLPCVTLCSALHLQRDPAARLAPFFAGWRHRPAHWPTRLRNRLAFGLLDLVAWPLLRHLNRRRRASGLAPHRRLDDALSPLARLSQLPPELAYAEERDAPLLHLVGPLFDARERDAQDALLGEHVDEDAAGDARPLVYATLGTSAHAGAHLYARLARAALGLPVRLVVNLGGRALDPRIQRDLPPNARLVAHAPQVRLVREAAAVIAHAGLSTTLECLSLGKPLLMVPLESDQAAIAARVTAAGAGLSVKARPLEEATLRAALVELLETPAYARAAARLAAALARRRPARDAGDVVERVLEGARS